MNDDELKLFNDYSNISDNQKNAFLSNIEADMKYKVHYYKCEYDFTWLNVMEDTIKYIDNIVKEPKVFILNNEEIVQVEKSKKISVESVVHLTQHSGFVSKYDQRTGEIRPSKILNVIREETMDIYENRFIFTLINKMAEFVETYGVLALENNSSMNNKSLIYNAKTKKNNEYINIKLNIESLEDKSINSKEKTIKLNERIENIRDKIHSFRHTMFYKEMVSLNVPEVKSPIKKTNVILKNPNFQRAEYLWHFLETFDKNVKKETKSLKNYSNNREVENKLNTAFLMNYAIFENSDFEKEEDINDINLSYLKSNIRNYLAYDTFIDEEKFIKMIEKEYRNVRKEQEKNYIEIRKIVEKDLNNFNEYKNNIRSLLQGE